MEKYVLFFSKVIKISLFRRKERRKYLGTSTPPKSSTGNQCRKIFLYLYQCEKKVLDPKERVTNEILRCNLCGKETPSGNSNLLLHLRHHHPQVDGGKCAMTWQGAKAGRAFAEKFGLERKFLALT